jgi:hypothetical protein
MLKSFTPKKSGTRRSGCPLPDTNQQTKMIDGSMNILSTRLITEWSDTIKEMGLCFMQIGVGMRATRPTEARYA